MVQSIAVVPSLANYNCLLFQCEASVKAPANSTPRALRQKRFFYLLTFKYLYSNDYCGCDNIHGGITSYYYIASSASGQYAANSVF